MLRQKDLCPTPAYCPEVAMEESFGVSDGLPCPHCPAQLLSEYLESPGGRLISVVIDLDFALQIGVSIPASQISYPAFLLLRQLAEERDKYQTEQVEKASRKR